MKNNNPKLMITLLSILVGILMASQMKLNLEHLTPVTIQSIFDKKAEVEFARNEIVELGEIIIQKETELKTLENINTGDVNIIDILKSDLDENIIKAGYSSLNGAG